MCKECEELRAQNVALKARVESLRKILNEVLGGKVEFEEDPYEDEQPLVREDDE